MHTEYVAPEHPADHPKVSLSSIWIVDADETYDVARRDAALDNMHTGELVAIHTVAGRGEVSLVSGQTAQIGRETVMIVRNCNLRRYRCLEANWKFRWFSFLTGSEELFPLDEVAPAATDADETARVRECMSLLDDDDPWKQREASALFFMLLCRWMVRRHTNCQPAMPNEQAMMRACGFMKSNLDQPIQISVLAGMHGFSENQFRNLYKRKYGLAPKQHLQQMRVNAARALLMQTGQPLSDIAFSLGYSSQFHFTREFKKLTGIAPSKYRQDPSAMKLQHP